MLKKYSISSGSRYPLGATSDKGGVNFSIFSRHATRVELLLYEYADSTEPFQIISLDPNTNRTAFFWHVYVRKLPPLIHYTWRVDGPGDTQRTGFRFNYRKELLDPWARAITNNVWDRKRASDPDDESHTSMRAIVVHDNYSWHAERHINHSLEGAVIYELHVGGFTRHPSSDTKHPGKFAGLIEKIPYLKELGITHVELMPVMAFDPYHMPKSVAARGNINYWGYSTHSFYSPHPAYCITPEKGTHIFECKDMIKEFHKADIKVLLDVVFNHTAEGDDEGPIINFKGLENDIFYLLDPKDHRRYLDYTGCGNTINGNHPLVTLFIVHCLEYWRESMHVDGFRFDLASIFTRGVDGVPIPNAPLPWFIEFSRIIADMPLIAEAWDAAGLYQVGHYPGYRWSEWNGRYRDIIRRFVRGDAGLVGDVATCIGGSSDLFARSGRLPVNSINFITAHDGFTLYDLVSYNNKYNEINGQNNRDGTDLNFSWNCGVEGETINSDIIALRRKQCKNFIAILMLSLGVPMILSGDEVLRTQKGNNNAWCHDNDLTWLDWRLMEINNDMLRFVREMISFRRRHPSLMRNHFLTGKIIPERGLPDVAWHGTRPGEPPWHDHEARFLAFTISGLQKHEENLHAILNMSDRTIEVDIPALATEIWFLCVDTSIPSPHDISVPRCQKIITGNRYLVRPRSVVILESRGANIR